MQLEMLTRRERKTETDENGFTRTWIEYATGRCACGAIVELSDPMDNECDCGRWFNWGGQEVIPMHECRDHDDY